MFKLPVYFVSDNHFSLDISPSETLRRKKLFSLFEKIKDTQGSLVIGGDFFDFWFDYKHVVPKGFNDLLYKLEELSNSGVIIHYILGNHDYWDFGSFTEKFGAVVHDGNLVFEANNRTVLITHGDGLLRGDWGYRLMKKVLRSRLCISLFRLFHPDWGCALAQSVSNTSSHYHHHDDSSEEIREEMINFARTQWSDGIDDVLIGHYHQTGIEEYDDKRLIFMGDWLKHFTATILDESGWRQLEWK